VAVAAGSRSDEVCASRDLVLRKGASLTGELSDLEQTWESEQSDNQQRSCESVLPFHNYLLDRPEFLLD
jgi:hypothetical protein